jgi:hypothetical protein
VDDHQVPSLGSFDSMSSRSSVDRVPSLDKVPSICSDISEDGKCSKFEFNLSCTYIPNKSTGQNGVCFRMFYYISNLLHLPSSEISEQIDGTLSREGTLSTLLRDDILSKLPRDGTW